VPGGTLLGSLLAIARNGIEELSDCDEDRRRLVAGMTSPGVAGLQLISYHDDLLICKISDFSNLANHIHFQVSNCSEMTRLSNRGFSSVNSLESVTDLFH